MNTCNTCVHWILTGPTQQISKVFGFELRACLRMSLISTSTQPNEAGMLDGNDVLPLTTGPAFGCVLWEPALDNAPQEEEDVR